MSLAFVGPILGQTKTSPEHVNNLGNVNLSLAAPAGLSLELVTNGGFETGDFTGWTQSGNTNFVGVDSSNPHSGIYAAYFGSTGSLGFITQDLATTTDALYDLTFWLENDDSIGGPSHFEVSWNGSVLDSIDDGPEMPYTFFSYPGLMAASASTALQFGFQNDPAFWYLDDVSVELHPAAPPPDFNHDNYPDFVLFNTGSLRTAIWFLNNNTFMDAVYGPNLPAGWNMIDATDFDGDGHVDYVLFNSGSRRTAIWYLVDTNFGSAAYGPTLPTGWALVATGDFNGDGHPDFVLYNSTTRRTAIWFLDNNSLIGSAYGPTIAAGWNLIDVADFNRDGRPEYVLFKASTRQTAIWYLMGTTFMSSAFGPTPPPGWELIGVADFNINAAPDYLLFNAGTRRTAIWYLNNNILTSSAFGPTTPPNWTIVVP